MSKEEKKDDVMSVDEELFTEDAEELDTEDGADDQDPDDTPVGDEEEPKDIEAAEEDDKPAEVAAEEPTDAQRELKELKAENTKLIAKNKKLYKDDKKKHERLKELEPKVEDIVLDDLTEDEIEQLNADPQKFIKEQVKKVSERVKKLKEDKTDTDKQEEVNEQIADAHSELKVTHKDFDDVMLNDKGFLKVDHIPPAKFAEWEEKGLTVKEQMVEAYNMLKGAKAKNPETLKQPSLGDMGGTAKQKATDKNTQSNYDDLM